MDQPCHHCGKAQEKETAGILQEKQVSDPEKHTINQTDSSQPAQYERHESRIAFNIRAFPGDFTPADSARMDPAVESFQMLERDRGCEISTYKPYDCGKSYYGIKGFRKRDVRIKTNI